jgi:HAD superfamily hydrolase (TIGR01549 family)
MIKKIIFDLDNTLIEWKSGYNESLRQAIESIGIECTDQMLDDMNKAYLQYERDTVIYNKEEMLDYVGKAIGVMLPIEVIDIWFEKLANCYDTINQDIIDTLEYLSSKYELVILTNWYTESQTNRLRNSGILKYFSNVFGADLNPKKPLDGGYIEAIKPYEFNECVMVGDNLKEDVIKPNELGIRGIWLNESGEKHNEYETISKLSELKEMII